jgi:hypothetical protein
MHPRAALVAALVAAGLGLAGGTGLAPASADPVLPVDPLVPVPGPVAAPAPADPAVAAAPALPANPVAAPAPSSAGQTMLGGVVQALQNNPFGTMKDLIANSPQQAAIGLASPPPGTGVAATAQDPLALSQQLRPENFRMPSPDQVSPYALAPNDNPSAFARVNAFKGVHAMVHSNLGRMPGSELGQPLPGTAPTPGSNIPAGLEQFYAAPVAPAPAPADAAAPPAAPVDPLLLTPGSAPPPPPAG